MSNINIRNSSSCLEFLGDCEIRSIEVKNGDELNGNEIIGLLIDNDVYELVVSMNEGKKEGIGMIVREDGTLFMRMMFVNDECEGEVTKMNKYGNTVLKGRVSKGKEVGMWIEYDDGTEIWRGLYRNGKRYVTLILFKLSFYIIYSQLATFLCLLSIFTNKTHLIHYILSTLSI